MEFKVNITGSGTPQQIVDALNEIVKSIQEAQKSKHQNAVLDGAVWEGPTLITEIEAE